MFCPNCGNNCGDAKFCVKCGTKVLQEPVTPVVQVPNTSCPHCGGTITSGSKCSFCGKSISGQDSMSGATTSVPAEIPYGTYNGVKSALSLFEKHLAIEQIPFFLKKTVTNVPYNKLTKVLLYQATPNSRLGLMLFRWEENKDLPIPKNPFTDKFSVTVPVESEYIFYHIFYALKTVAPNATSFQFLRPEMKVEKVKQIVSQYNIDQYFDEFAPDRAKAISALCTKAGFAEPVSKGLIDWVFDMRQYAIYSAEPKAAIRDLHLVVAEAKHQADVKAQERAKRDEQYARDAALAALEQIKRNQNQ